MFPVSCNSKTAQTLKIKVTGDSIGGRGNRVTGKIRKEDIKLAGVRCDWSIDRNLVVSNQKNGSLRY